MFLGGSISDILPPLAILLGFVIVGGVVILRIRKSLHSPTDKSTTYSLSDLRKMLEAGDLNDDEYSKARDAIINQTSNSTPDSHEKGSSDT